MSVENSVIISDLDGTIVNILEQLQLYVWKRWAVWFPEECITQFDVHEPIHSYIQTHSSVVSPTFKFPQTVEEFKTKLVSRFWSNPGPYAQSMPYYDLWQALLYWNGPLVFLTARPENLRECTEWWLKQWGLKRCQLVMSFNKVQATDTIITQYAGYDVNYIDDKAEDCIDIKKYFKSKITCYTVLAPWNAWARKQTLRRRRNVLAKMIYRNLL